MEIDWNIFATIAAPIITLFIGVWVNRRFENRPILITYFSHVSTFKLTQPQGELLQINSHSVVLRNIGRERAENVRLNHAFLPSFNIYPAIVHNIETLSDDSSDIVIPILVPGEEIIVSYMYFPPLIAGQINSWPSIVGLRSIERTQPTNYIIKRMTC